MILKVDVVPEVFAKLSDEIWYLKISRDQVDPQYNDWVRMQNDPDFCRANNETRVLSLSSVETAPLVRILRAPYDPDKRVLQVTLEVEEKISFPCSPLPPSSRDKNKWSDSGIEHPFEELVLPVPWYILGKLFRILGLYPA